MSDKPFVDNNGDKLEDYAALRLYQLNNPVECVMNTIVYNEDEVLICTMQSGLNHAFKTVVSCEEHQDCKYHSFIADTNSIQDSIDKHAELKLKIENGEDLEPQDDELIIIEEDE